MKFQKKDKMLIFNVSIAVLGMIFVFFILGIPVIKEIIFFQASQEKRKELVDDNYEPLVDKNYISMAQKAIEIKTLLEMYPDIKALPDLDGGGLLHRVDYYIHKRINNKDEELRVRVMVDILSEEPDSIKFYCSRSKIPPFLYNLFIIDKLEYIKQEKCFR